MVIISLVLMLLIINYVVLYGVLLKNNGHQSQSAKDNTSLFVSIVIPFRNEAQNLNSLFQSIECLNYPKSHFEVILINDHSTDDSLKIAKQRMAESDVKFILLELEEKEGKKNALETGFRVSIGEILIQTDADVVIQEEWISEHVKGHQCQDAFLLCGSVHLTTKNSIFHRLQQMEFNALMMSTKITINAHLPVMCNAANMSFKREVINSVFDSYAKIKSSSGDDVFLMHEIAQKYGAKKIHYLDSLESVVFIKATNSLRDFVNQRSRWVKKSREYAPLFPKYFTLSIIFANFSLLGLAIFMVIGIYFQTYLWIIIFIVGFLIKWLADIVVLKKYRKDKPKWYQKNCLMDSLLLEMIYPLYIIVVGLNSLFAKQMWKGRVVF